ncbi:putative late blight resistance protein homolog R1C-3 [Salvia hispanica]|uniref:putative late blight resistance protein homolog R1C-3 n=1 Tax=Salvia hispanica TaxID=49212 RepID=UPI0020094F41|nr:putative late blight resistance protein homolog R1C-3 [Salvia hispanica]
MAAEMFRSSEIHNHFNKLIWVSVSDPTEKNILLLILRQLDPSEPPRVIPFELRKQVGRLLKEKKILLVLNDVPKLSKEDLKGLLITLGESDKGSKVLITGDNPEVANFVEDDSLIELKLLKHEQSWDLLKWELLKKLPCPPEFEIHGQLIAENCNGLPRDIVSTANALITKLRRIDDPSGRIQLVAKNLVKIEEKRLDGSAKTCSITESIHKFCQKESEPDRENFLQEFIKHDREGFFPVIDGVKKNRRVCVHGHISKFIPKFISSSRQEIWLRSFVSHSNEAFTLHKNDISKIRAAFNLLRVLDAKPINVKRIHSELCLLVHLRYVTLSLKGDVLPEAISKLRNVQTLIVHTTSRTLKIEANILVMVELRHFETNASATLPKKSGASEEDERLETLCGISPKSCTSELFEKLPNLKKLGICGQLALLLDGKNDLLCKLDKVEKLKLLNQEETGDEKLKLPTWITSSKQKGQLNSLILGPSTFHGSLRTLTLSATCLSWEHIFVLGTLQQLEELMLKDNAFSGKEWKVHDDGFPHLQILKIKNLHFENWKCSRSHFPRIRRIVLFKCEQLQEIPIELAHIPTFQELHLQNGGEIAKICAMDIREKKLEMRNTNHNIVFKLLPKDIFR